MIQHLASILFAVQKQLRKSTNCNKKAYQNTDIFVKIIKGNKGLISYFIHQNFNNSLLCHEIRCHAFPTAMKYADVKPINKRGDKTDKENYRPISILANLSKTYERIMYNQICPYFNTMFSKFQRGFPKWFNAQHCLLLMIEKCSEILDNGGETGAVFTCSSQGT